MKQYVFFGIAGILMVLTAPSAMAQEDVVRQEKIEKVLPFLDKMFADFAIKNHVPGLIYGLIVDGKLAHTFSTGVTDVANKVPVTPTSDFRIASMTKSFTAMAILKLRDEGKLKLDDPIGNYIPELKNQKYLTKDAAPITIRHLLTHAAGLPEDNPWGDRQLEVSDQLMLIMISKGISFSTVPGSRYEYSNLGFAILGYLIKVVSGMSYERYITDNVLVPLGMTSTYWVFSRVPVTKLAHGYRWINGTYVEQPILRSGAYGAMGGLMTTMEDFSKYVAFHLSAWPPSNDPEIGPLKRSSLREMHHSWNFNNIQAQFRYASGRACPLVSGYGYGLRIMEDCDNRLIVGHSGGLPGFGSDWKILPEFGIGLVSFGNVTYSPQSGINLQALDTLVALAGLKPRSTPVSAILSQRKNELLKIIPAWKDETTLNIFADNFWLDYFPDSLRKEASIVFEHAGKINKVGDVIAENNLRGYFILEGEKKNIQVSFTLTPEPVPMIQQYGIREVNK